MDCMCSKNTNKCASKEEQKDHTQMSNNSKRITTRCAMMTGSSLNKHGWRQLKKTNIIILTKKTRKKGFI